MEELPRWGKPGLCNYYPEDWHRAFQILKKYLRVRQQSRIDEGLTQIKTTQTRVLIFVYLQNENFEFELTIITHFNFTKGNDYSPLYDTRPPMAIYLANFASFFTESDDSEIRRCIVVSETCSRSTKLRTAKYQCAVSSRNASLFKWICGVGVSLMWDCDRRCRQMDIYTPLIQGRSLLSLVHQCVLLKSIDIDAVDKDRCYMA